MVCLIIIIGECDELINAYVKDCFWYTRKHDIQHLVQYGFFFPTGQPARGTEFAIISIPRNYNEDETPSDLWGMVYDLTQATANNHQEAEVTTRIEDGLWYIFSEGNADQSKAPFKFVLYRALVFLTLTREGQSLPLSNITCIIASLVADFGITVSNGSWHVVCK